MGGWCQEEPCLYCILKPGDVPSLHLHVQQLDRNKELCKQSEQWGVGAGGPLKKKQPSAEFESGTYIQHTWGAGVGGSSGGE